MSGLYAKIAAPVLTDLSLTFELDGGGSANVLNRVLPAELPDLFSGQQLTVVGRYAPPSSGDKAGDLDGTFTLTGTSTAGDGEQLTFNLPATLPADSDETAAFVPALWATRRIGELIDQIDPQRREPRTGAGTRPALHAVRHPHALHGIPGRGGRAAG